MKPKHLNNAVASNALNIIIRNTKIKYDILFEETL